MATRGATLSVVFRMVEIIVSSITSTQPSWVRIWNMDMKAWNEEGLGQPRLQINTGETGGRH